VSNPERRKGSCLKCRHSEVLYYDGEERSFMCKAGCGIPLAYYPPYEWPAIMFPEKYCYLFEPREREDEG
jgi:hypothetical protein